jgi:hypothetical protein
VTRYKKLNLPTYWAGVYPVLSFGKARATVGSGARGAAPSDRDRAVVIDYPADPVRQYLEYGAMYDDSLRSAGARPTTRGRSGR